MVFFGSSLRSASGGMSSATSSLIQSSSSEVDGFFLSPGVSRTLKNVASAYIERWNLVLGAIFVAIVVFMPEGLVPGSVRLARWAMSWWTGRARLA